MLSVTHFFVLTGLNLPVCPKPHQPYSLSCAGEEGAEDRGLLQPVSFTHSKGLCDLLQEYAPDLIVVDFIFAGGIALADKLGIPKAFIFAAHFPPIPNLALGSGHLLSTVPQFDTALPRVMVRHAANSLLPLLSPLVTQQHIFCLFPPLRACYLLATVPQHNPLQDHGKVSASAHILQLKPRSW